MSVPHCLRRWRPMGMGGLRELIGVGRGLGVRCGGWVCLICRSFGGIVRVGGRSLVLELGVGSGLHWLSSQALVMGYLSWLSSSFLYVHHSWTSFCRRFSIYITISPRSGDRSAVRDIPVSSRFLRGWCCTGRSRGRLRPGGYPDDVVICKSARSSQSFLGTYQYHYFPGLRVSLNFSRVHSTLQKSQSCDRHLPS